MRSDRFLAFSPALGHDLELYRYASDGGVAGQPLLAFPSMNGRVWDWENFGMVEAVRPLVEAGRVTLYISDGIDWQSWTAGEKTTEERVARHADYDRYAVTELLPRVRRESGHATVWAAGCSMGAFHATNLFVRYPELVDGLIAISGVYQPRRFIGDFSDGPAIDFSPLDRLALESDPERLALYRRARITLCVGQGRWEEEMIADTHAMDALFATKAIPAMVDFWGHDVDHDWPWWQKMLPYHLERLLG